MDLLSNEERLTILVTVALTAVAFAFCGVPLTFVNLFGAPFLVMIVTTVLQSWTLDRVRPGRAPRGADWIALALSTAPGIALLCILVPANLAQLDALKLNAVQDLSCRVGTACGLMLGMIAGYMVHLSQRRERYWR